jgi:hypothetical protein
MTLTQARLHELLHYDPETGVFTWLVSRGRVAAGQTAGTIFGNGYRYVGLDGRSYKTNRLAWLYMTGEWPTTLVDHEDLDETNDRWSNLRSATKSENGANCGPRASNTSGFKGVIWNKANRNWNAQIRVRGQQMYLGRFNTAEEASAAYANAAREHFGDFARVAA